MKPIHIFLLLLLIEIFSFFAWLAPVLMPLFFALTVAVGYLITVRKLENGLLILFAELIIGSMGYLFWLDTGITRLSIRLGLFMTVMLVWFFKFFIPLAISYFKEKKYNNRFLLDFKSPTAWFFIIFGFMIISVVVALFKGNNQNNIFFDLNGWLYFFLLLPILSVLKAGKNDGFIKKIIVVCSAAIVWISAKTLILLFLFSHNFSFLPYFYKWVRDTRIGEITQMDGGFSRIFFQSHIFVSIAFFVFFIFLTEHLNRNFNLKELFKTWKFNKLFIASIMSILVSIISFSRSNWVGMMLGICVMLTFIITNHPTTKFSKPINIKLNPKLFLKSLALLAGSGLIGLAALFFIIAIPIPGANSDINAGQDIKDRLTNAGIEAGASSRWNLLPVLRQELKNNLIMGSGFGSTVTYTSNDPRIRQENPNGGYTTYAYEWGWIDIWLKLGLFGFISYLILLSTISYEGLKMIAGPMTKNREIIIGLCFGLVVISGVNFFSPYLNHPLGIGYILFVYMFIKLNSDSESTKSQIPSTK